MSYLEIGNEFLKLERRVERVQFADGDEIHQARMKWMEFNRTLSDRSFDEVQKPLPAKTASDGQGSTSQRFQIAAADDLA